jgi:hypothetical protein
MTVDATPAALPRHWITLWITRDLRAVCCGQSKPEKQKAARHGPAAFCREKRNFQAFFRRFI